MLHKAITVTCCFRRDHTYVCRLHIRSRTEKSPPCAPCTDWRPPRHAGEGASYSSVQVSATENGWCMSEYEPNSSSEIDVVLPPHRRPTPLEYSPFRTNPRLPWDRQRGYDNGTQCTIPSNPHRLSPFNRQHEYPGMTADTIRGRALLNSVAYPTSSVPFHARRGRTTFPKAITSRLSPYTGLPGTFSIYISSSSSSSSPSSNGLSG